MKYYMFLDNWFESSVWVLTLTPAILLVFGPDSDEVSGLVSLEEQGLLGKNLCRIGESGVL